MLSDIKQQLNRMQEDARQAASEAASAATAVTTDAIAEVIRMEIRRAMSVKGAGGAPIRDMISKEIVHLQGDDYAAGWLRLVVIRFADSFLKH